MMKKQRLESKQRKINESDLLLAQSKIIHYKSKIAKIDELMQELQEQREYYSNKDLEVRSEYECLKSELNLEYPEICKIWSEMRFPVQDVDIMLRGTESVGDCELFFNTNKRSKTTTLFEVKEFKQDYAKNRQKLSEIIEVLESGTIDISKASEYDSQSKRFASQFIKQVFFSTDAFKQPYKKLDYYFIIENKMSLDKPLFALYKYNTLTNKVERMYYKLTDKTLVPQHLRYSIKGDKLYTFNSELIKDLFTYIQKK